MWRRRNYMMVLTRNFKCSFVFIIIPVLLLGLYTPNATGFTFHDEWCTRSHCYQWQNTAKNWRDAKQSCIRNGGHLASIRDFGAHHLAEAAMKWNGEDMIWLGASIKKTSENPKCGVMRKVSTRDGDDHVRRRRHAPRDRGIPPWFAHGGDSDDGLGFPEPEAGWGQHRRSREWDRPRDRSDQEDSGFPSETDPYRRLERGGSHDFSPEVSGEQTTPSWEFETRSCFIDLPLICLYERASAWETCMPTFVSCGEKFCAKAYSDAPVTWLEARQICHGYDGSLPNVTSRDLIDQWLAALPCSADLLRHVDQAWTITTGIELQWASGEDVSFSSWSWKHPPHEPVEGCVAMHSRSGWMDYNCDVKLPFICETVKKSNTTSQPDPRPDRPETPVRPRSSTSASTTLRVSTEPSKATTNPDRHTRQRSTVTFPVQNSPTESPTDEPDPKDREDSDPVRHPEEEDDGKTHQESPSFNGPDSGVHVVSQATSGSPVNGDGDDQGSDTDSDTETNNDNSEGTESPGEEDSKTTPARDPPRTTQSPTTTITEDSDGGLFKETTDNPGGSKDTSGLSGSEGSKPHLVGVDANEAKKKEWSGSVDKEVDDSALNANLAKGNVVPQESSDKHLGIYIGVPLLVVFLVLLVAILSMRARRVKKSRDRTDPVNMNNPNYDTEVSSSCAMPSAATMVRPGLNTLDHVRNPNVIHVHKPITPMDSLKCWNLYQTLDSLSSDESIPRGPVNHHYASLENEANVTINGTPFHIIRRQNGGPYIQQVIIGGEEGDYAELDITATVSPLQPSAPPHHASSRICNHTGSSQETHPGTFNTAARNMIGRARMPEPHLADPQPANWKYSYDILSNPSNIEPRAGPSNPTLDEEDTTSSDHEYFDYDIAHYDKADSGTEAPPTHMLRNRDSLLLVDNDLYHTQQRDK